MLNGPPEQAADGVLEMSALVLRSGRHPFLDLFPGNGRDGQIACRIRDLLQDRPALFTRLRRERNHDA
jgi:hypothetical protein